jgi:hypothetical protein
VDLSFSYLDLEVPERFSFAKEFDSRDPKSRGVAARMLSQLALMKVLNKHIAHRSLSNYLLFPNYGVLG